MKTSDPSLLTPVRLFADALFRVTEMAARLGLEYERYALETVLQAHENGSAARVKQALYEVFAFDEDGDGLRDLSKLKPDPAFPPPGWNGKTPYEVGPC